jgi:hypothetical protein
MEQQTVPSASQEVHCLLWNALTFPSYFPQIHFNIIFPSTPRCPEWCILSPCMLHAPPISPSLIYLILITFCDGYKLWSCPECSFLQLPITSSLAGPNVHPNTCCQKPSICEALLSYRIPGSCVRRYYMFSHLSSLHGRHVDIGSARKLKV